MNNLKIGDKVKTVVPGYPQSSMTGYIIGLEPADEAVLIAYHPNARPCDGKYYHCDFVTVEK